jgi:hypothetical protein
MTTPFLAIRVARRGLGTLHRAAYLTPYLAETIAADVLRTGPGTRLDVVVRPRSALYGPEWVRAQLAWLADRGVEVRVRGARTTQRRPAAA